MDTITEFYTKIQEHLPIDVNDESLIVLKGHLLCEEYINEYLNECLPNATHLEKSRFQMSAKISICKAASDDERHDKWVWKGIEKLNSLRNSYAHSLIPKKTELENRRTNFINYMENQKLPKPNNFNANKLALNIMLLCAGIFVIVNSLRNEKNQ